MNVNTIETLKTALIFIPSLALFYTIIKDVLNVKKPRLDMKIEFVKIIEDYQGELGIQINLSFRAYNGSFFLRNLEITHKTPKVNQLLENQDDMIKIRQFCEKDIIGSYLCRDKQTKIVIDKNQKRKDDLVYLSYCYNYDLKKDSYGNPILPIPESNFERSRNDLCQEITIGQNISRNIAPKIPSIRDIKIDDYTPLSLTLFVDIYGKLNTNTCQREKIPLQGWKLTIFHSEGIIKKEIKVNKENIIFYERLEKE